MSENPIPKRPKPSVLLAWFLFLFVRIILLSMLAWILLEGWFTTMAFLQGPDKVLLQTQQIVQSELPYLQNHVVFQMTILHEMETAENHLDVWISNLKITETKYYSWLTLFETVTEIVFIRVLIFGFSLPFYLLMSSIAFIDGFVQRAIRKYRGARESTFKFHRAKHVLSWMIFMPYLFILSCPIELPMSLVLCLHACLIAIVLWYMVMHFKKYI